MNTINVIPSHVSITDITLESLKNHATKIHYFGLGFIQIKLGERERIHFYTPSLSPIVHEEEVHNHRYGFHSFVLYGEYRQELFQMIEGNTHTLEDESCVDPNIEISTQEKKRAVHSCSVKKIADVSLKKGSHYYIDSETFHRVKTSEAITFLVREKPLKKFAQVIKEKNAPSVCPFSLQISEDMLWQKVAELLSQAKGN